MAQSSDDGKVELKSSYIRHLPGLYSKDEFMGRFLLIFESILSPIERTVDNIPLYLDPLLTNEQMLPWLASWIDLTLDPSWPLRRRRELVKSAVELYRWRGTRRGLSEYLRIYTGKTPEIIEHIPGPPLGPDFKLGPSARLGSSGGGFHFTVTVEADDPPDFDTEKIRTIIDSQKPAHTVYTLRIKGPSGKGEDRNGT